MTPKKQLYSRGFRSILSVSLLGCVSSLVAQDDDESNNVYTLSPFVVDASEDTGYRATSTLAGTRVNTDLKDLGSSISVYTMDVLEDLDSTDSETLLSFATGSEIGGEQGNFSGIDGTGQGQNNRIFSNDARVDPQSASRIRGLGRAENTRDYFRRDFAYDSYNIERVTISRGANGLLFGIGSPGGVVNVTTKRAVIGQDLNKVSVRVDDFGSFRSAVDFNRTIIEDRLAVRFNGLYEDQQFNQRQAYDEDKRFHLAAEAILFRNENSNVFGETRINLNGEWGGIDSSPVQTTPPSVAYHNWFEPVDTGITALNNNVPASRIRSPEDGGTWEFQETYNPFATNSNENSINTQTRSTIFRHMAVVFADGSVDQANAGLNAGIAAGAEGWGGFIPFNNSSDTVASAGLAGTPGPAAAGLADGDSLGHVRLFHTNSPFGTALGDGFTVPTVQNRNVFDYRNNVYSGDVDLVNRDFFARNATLSQALFDDKLNLSLAFDSQHYQTVRDFFFTGGNGTSQTGSYDVYIDITEFMQDGQPNPNLGRPYTRVARPEVRNKRVDRETIRFQANANLDFTERDGFLRNLGEHSITGLWGTHQEDNLTVRSFDAWITADPDNPVENVQFNRDSDHISHFLRPLNTIVYTGPSALGVATMDDVRFSPMNISRPQPGDQFNIFQANLGSGGDRELGIIPFEVARYDQTGSINRIETDSWAGSIQSKFWEGNISTLYGLRNDHERSTGRDTELDLRDDEGVLIPGSLVLNPEGPGAGESGYTRTYSVVLRYPENLFGELPAGMDFQIQYAESENFNPVGQRRNVFGEILDSPTGTTKEYGFLLGLNEGRYTIRANWYESDVKNATANGVFDATRFVVERYNVYRRMEADGQDFITNGLEWDGVDRSDHPIQSYEEFYDAMFNAIPVAAREANNLVLDIPTDGGTPVLEREGIGNLRATRDTSAEGFEVEITADLTDNWRALINIGKQETVNSNTGGANAELLNVMRANLDASRLLELNFNGFDASGQSMLGRWIADGGSTIARLAALDGTIVQEQREWTVTGVTSYKFSDGRFDGLSVGGSFRWLSEAATGYPTFFNEDVGAVQPIVSRPFKDDGLFNASVFVGYETTIFEGVDWKIRLNIRNIVGSSDDIVTRTNPDGRIAAIRNPNPTGISLTNTFEF